MSDITLSKAVRSNLLNLQSTASLLGKSQERLSTGLRVNSALDNPTNFFTAQGLNSRANDLSQLLDSVSNAVQTVAAADKGISAITKLVESAQATARQALQTAASVTTAAAATSGTVTAGTFSTLDVSGTASAATAGTLTGTGFSTVNVGGAGSAAQAATITGGSNYTPVDVSGGTKTFTIDIGGGAQTVTLDSAGSGGDDAYSVSELQTAIDTALGGSGIVTVGGGVSAPLTLTTVATGASANITVAGTDIADLGFTTGDTDTGAAAVAADSISFSITPDGGAAQSITLSAASVATYNGANSTSLNASSLTAQNVVDIINYQSGPNVASLSSGQIRLQSTTTGASSSIAIGAISTAGSATNTTGLTGSTSNTGAAAVAADSISFSLTVDGGSAQTITIDAAAVTAYNGANSTSLSASALTAQNVADIINYQSGPNVASVVSGALTFTSTTTGTSSSIAVASFTSAGTPTGSTGIANASNTGAAATSTSGANPKRAELVETYNDLLEQIDQLAKDSGFNGVNLLNGDNLSVLFNEDGSSKLDIAGVTNSATGLGLTALGTTAFDTNTSINSTLDDLKGAIDTLRTQSAKFGSNLSVVETRQDFTKNMINVLQTGASNLTLADTNEEAANVLALQTRQQLSSTALSLASQADQNVLRLF